MKLIISILTIIGLQNCKEQNTDPHGNCKGSFLRLKEESADPRGWANVNLNINKDSISFHIFSYVEEKLFNFSENSD
ncbi:hypothetical protein [Chryseobacterium sp. MMS23-Vi53]|uniref:hypothetical protein n=1 Tax=Chryseobacterium sp. MMS23-Vi53 TaxID=3386644 RepID=UPI0039E8FF93